MIASILIVGAIPLSVFLFMLSRRLYRRHVSRFENLDVGGVLYYLRMLLERGLDGAFMIFDDMNSGRFLQFRKYVNHQKQVGIECHLPRAPWSESYYGDFEALVTASGVSFEEVSGSGQPVSTFVKVDFERDVDLASEFVEGVFTKLFGLPHVSVRVRSHGITTPKAVKRIMPALLRK